MPMSTLVTILSSSFSLLAFAPFFSYFLNATKFFLSLCRSLFLYLACQPHHCWYSHPATLSPLLTPSYSQASLAPSLPLWLAHQALKAASSVVSTNSPPLPSFCLLLLSPALKHIFEVFPLPKSLYCPSSVDHLHGHKPSVPEPLPMSHLESSPPFRAHLPTPPQCSHPKLPGACLSCAQVLSPPHQSPGRVITQLPTTLIRNRASQGMFFFSFETVSCYVVPTGLKLMIFLPQFPMHHHAGQVSVQGDATKGRHEGAPGLAASEHRPQLAASMPGGRFIGYLSQALFLLSSLPLQHSTGT
jgi:hypothetical protein